MVLVLRVSAVFHGLDGLCLLPLQLELHRRMGSLSRIILSAPHLVRDCLWIGSLAIVGGGTLWKLLVFLACAVSIGSPSEFGGEWWRLAGVISVHGEN